MWKHSRPGTRVVRREKELRDSLDTIPAIVFTAQPDGFNDFQSRGWLEYPGLSPESSAGHGWAAAVHPDDLDAASGIFNPYPAKTRGASTCAEASGDKPRIASAPSFTSTVFRSSISCNEESDSSSVS
jgi:PAS domain-containing protein